MMLAVASPPPLKCYASARAAYPASTKIVKVVRDGDWAVVRFEDEVADADLFIIRHGRWCAYGHGKGGALPLAAWGVPPDVARRLSAKLYGRP